MDYEFYGITMKTKTGRTLYLRCSNKETKNPYKILMDWTFDINEACLWEDYNTCDKFAKKYFKNFNQYNINLINVGYNNLKCYVA